MSRSRGTLARKGRNGSASHALHATAPALYSTVKRRVNPGLGFGAFHTAQQTIQGYEAIHKLRKGQLEGVAKGDVLAQNRVINQLFGLAASQELTSLSSHSHECWQYHLYPWDH